MRWRGVQLDGPAVAKVRQQVEHEVVGAPCGLMDQMTMLVGKKASCWSCFVSQIALRDTVICRLICKGYRLRYSACGERC